MDLYRKTTDTQQCLPYSTSHPFVMARRICTIVENNSLKNEQNIRLIYTKRQSPNLKGILTNSLLTNKTAGVFKCSESRCLNVGTQFFQKTVMTCDSRNLVSAVLCPTCREEYIGENGTGDSKLRDRVMIYWQHIQQSEHEKLKVEKHLRTCGKGNFTIFPFLQLRSNDTDLRREYEDYFIKKYKTKLNSL